MERSRTQTDGTASEQASGPVAAFQDKMESWTDRVGYGAKRGLICGLFTAWGFAVVVLIVHSAQAALTHSFGKQDTGTLGEMLVNSFFFVVGLTIFVMPVGVIVGAILGAVGIIRKKKKTDGDAQT